MGGPRTRSKGPRLTTGLVTIAIAAIGLVPVGAAPGDAATTGEALPTFAIGWHCAKAVSSEGVVIGEYTRGVVPTPSFVFAWTQSTGLIDIAPTLSATLLDVSDDILLFNALDGPYTWSPDAGLEPQNFSNAEFRPQVIADGYIGGRLYASDGSHGAIWHSPNGFVAIPNSQTLDREVVDVNDRGQAIFQGRTTQGHRRSYFWDPQTGFKPLGNPFGAGVDVAVRDLNEAGVVVGAATFPQGTKQAFLWTAAAGMKTIGPLDGQTSALFVNNHGSVTGQTSVNGSDFAYLWTQRRGLVLTSLRGIPRGISDHDQIVGFTQPGGAFLWDPVAGVLVGGDNSFDVHAINNSGSAVGCAFGEDGQAPYRWTVDTNVEIHWTAAEVARLADLRSFYGYATDTDLVKAGVYVLAFLDGIAPQPQPTPIAIDEPGNDGSTIVSWQTDEINLLNATKYRWQLNDEDAHRWGFMVLSFLASLQGV